MPDNSHPLIGKRIVRRLSRARANARCVRCGDCQQVISFIVIGVANSRFAPRGQRTIGDNGETLLIQGYRIEPCPCNVEAALQMHSRIKRIFAPIPGCSLVNEFSRTLWMILRNAEKARPAMIAAAKDMIGSKPFGMLTIHGGPGNGKTLLMQGLANYFIGLGSKSPSIASSVP